MMVLFYIVGIALSLIWYQIWETIKREKQVMEDLYKETLMLKWANYKVTNKTSKMRRERLIKNSPKNNSLIIKKHNQRKMRGEHMKKNIESGFYKNPEFD
jgi:hypothetical protein